MAHSYQWRLNSLSVVQTLISRATPSTLVGYIQFSIGPSCTRTYMYVRVHVYTKYIMKAMEDKFFLCLSNTVPCPSHDQRGGLPTCHCGFSPHFSPFRISYYMYITCFSHSLFCMNVHTIKGVSLVSMYACVSASTVCSVKS